jgi:hypothetical protein
VSFDLTNDAPTAGELGGPGDGPRGDVLKVDATQSADSIVVADKQAAPDGKPTDGAVPDGAADGGKPGTDGSTDGALDSALPDQGADQGLPTDQAKDHAPDQPKPPVDQVVLPDQSPIVDHPWLPDLGPDQAVPDQGPDAGILLPVSEATLKQAFGSAQVPCIDDKGDPSWPWTTDIVDSSTVEFFDGAALVAAAPQETKNWVGSLPSVVIVWDIDACDCENPWSNCGSWNSAGLLIRGATLVSNNTLQLAPGTTVADINLLDVSGSGGYQNERAGADDSGLASTPQLVNPVNKAKELVIQLAQP